MATDTEIVQRLTVVEDVVDKLQRQMANLAPPANWLEQITGTFKDEPAFDEVLKFGQALRSTDRPVAHTGE
jgi:ubiquinone biosynthesis protein COQ9